MKEKDHLWKWCEQFIEEQNISCSETIYKQVESLEEEVCQKLIEEYSQLEPSSDSRGLAHFLSKNFHQIEKTKKAVLSIEKLRDEEYKRHKEAVKTLNSELIEIQKQCRHLSTTYYPDPSGNNDSSVVCNHCQKEASRASRL